MPPRLAPATVAVSYTHLDVYKRQTQPSRALLTRLEAMREEVQTPECRHWLEQELEGYSLCSPLSWYRIIACRQRGHFLNLKTGKYLTCHIGSQTLSQRDLAQVQFIYAREPAAHYLLRHDSHIEPWPESLLEAYREQLIPGPVSYTHLMGGISEEEDVFAPVSKAAKTRWAWLAINLCTAFVASRVIGLFEHTISQLVALAALMPIVAGIGGNTGNQTITMIVRALALQHIQTGNVSFLLWRELGVALINGLVWGGTMGAVSYTHLDVYKRQVSTTLRCRCRATPLKCATSRSGSPSNTRPHPGPPLHR